MAWLSCGEALTRCTGQVKSLSLEQQQLAQEQAHSVLEWVCVITLVSEGHPWMLVCYSYAVPFGSTQVSV